MCILNWNPDSEASRAAAFGVTVEQWRAGFAKNAAILRDMLAEAESTGRKVNGYTPAKLRRMIADHELLAQGKRPQS